MVTVKDFFSQYKAAIWATILGVPTVIAALVAINSNIVMASDLEDLKDNYVETAEYNVHIVKEEQSNKELGQKLDEQKTEFALFRHQSNLRDLESIREDIEGELYEIETEVEDYEAKNWEIPSRTKLRRERLERRLGDTNQKIQATRQRFNRALSSDPI